MKYKRVKKVVWQKDMSTVNNDKKKQVGTISSGVANLNRIPKFKNRIPIKPKMIDNEIFFFFTEKCSLC